MIGFVLCQAGNTLSTLPDPGRCESFLSFFPCHKRSTEAQRGEITLLGSGTAERQSRHHRLFFDPHPQCCGKGVPGSERCPCPCPPVFLQIIEAELRSTKRWELTAEGEEIAREGSHEARVFHSVPPEGLPQSELMVGV